MSPEGRLEQDRRARSAALDVTRSFIVQAPAGSGKTELLIQRYLALLATVDEPEEVIAITFTRKAAQEMQLRVAAALARAAREPAPAESHHRTTYEAARRVLERDARLGWQLVQSPRRLRIQTLDALNAGIARALPFSSGLGGAAAVMPDEELERFYGEAAAATLDWLLAEGSEAAAVEALLLHLDNNSGAFIAHIKGMLATRDQWLPLVGAGLAPDAGDEDVRLALEANIAELVEAHLRKLRGLFPAPHVPKLLRLARYAAGNGAATGSRWTDLPAAEAGRAEDWQALADLLLTRAGSFRKAVNGGMGFPPGDDGEKQEMQELLATLAAHDELAAALHKVRGLPRARYTDAQWSVLLALFRVLPLAVGELRRLFAEQGVTDYIEMALAADRALGSADEPGEIALLLDYGVRHLLIDEMQDTSIAQYRLLEKLVAGWQRGDGRTLFCVGDPMQSIYRFRNAEVGQFLLARTAGIGDVELESLVLTRNFRSCEELVNWFNRVFEDTLPAADDIAAGAIAYSASVAAAGRAPGTCRVHPLFGADAATEAGHGAAVVRECLRDSATDETIAVLVRSRTQLPLLLQELRAAKIDYQAVEIDRLTDLPEIIDLLALTRALCHPGDRIAWLGLLRGPWVGLTWNDLHTLVRNERRRTVWELLHDEVRTAALSADANARLAPVVAALAPFLAGHGTRSLRETVERAWYALRGPLLLASGSQVDNVYRYLDVLERLESAGTLPEVAELEAMLDDERASTGGSGARVQVMTMHKAKGLEFDHVVLYGLGRRPRGSAKPVLSWRAIPGRAGHDGLLISPIAPRAETDGDPLHAWIEAAARDKDRLEQDRLLYVACTRARQSLHLVGHVGVSADGETVNAPPRTALLSGIWSSLRGEYEAAFAARDAAAPVPLSPATADFRQPRLRRLPDGLRLPPAPPAAGSRGDDIRPDDETQQAVQYYWVGTITRHAGTVAHRWLQRLADGSVPVTNAGDLLPASRRWAADLGVPSPDVDAVCARAQAAVAQVVSDARGRWLLTGEGHAELPVTGLWNGRIESIVIDRVRIDDDGTHWIVDYKTSTHEGGDLAGFLAREQARYRPQLAKYAAIYGELTGAPVRAALYFPLLQAFVEVVL